MTAKRDWRQVVADRSERNARAGRLGAMAQRALYPANVRREWARRGGRPRDPMLSEIRNEVAR